MACLATLALSVLIVGVRCVSEPLHVLSAYVERNDSGVENRALSGTGLFYLANAQAKIAK